MNDDSVRFTPLIRAVINLLSAVDEQHDTKDSPHKYSVPYGAVNALRAALASVPPASTFEVNELRAALQPFVTRNSSEPTITITVKTEDVTRARAVLAKGEPPD